MTSDRPHGLLWDALRTLPAFRRRPSFKDYLANDMLSSAVERQLEIIGEALAALRRSDPALAAKIPNLHQAIGFRNVLIHGYASVDQIVWEVVQLHLPELEIHLPGHLPPAPQRGRFPPRVTPSRHRVRVSETQQEDDPCISAHPCFSPIIP